MDTIDKLINLRKRNDFSQQYIGKILDLPVSRISDIELRKRKINIDELAKLAELYGTSTDYLLGRKSLHTDTEKQADYERMAQMFLQKHNGDLQSAIKELMDELEKRNK